MAKKDNFDDVAAQIGDAGGSQPLGKLEHPEIYGEKAKLAEDENKSMDDFLKRAHGEREQRAEMHASIGGGWIPVDREEMGKRSLFYPASWEFYIKVPPVQTIKNWTSIDETDARQLNNVLTEVIRTSVKIVTNTAEGAGWAQINSWDRFWFIMKVREATFANGEAKIEFDDECSECHTMLTYNFTAKSLFFEYPDEELIEKYWDGTKWVVDPREYGANHDPITLYIPKLGKDEAIINWATAKAQARQKVDETFVKYLMWLMPRAYADNVLDSQITKIYNEYRTWDADTFEFMDDVINNLNVGTSETLTMQCPECGQETHSTVRFPNGIKKLFRTESKVKKFGSR